jgi:hypothetical protein
MTTKYYIEKWKKAPIFLFLLQFVLFTWAQATFIMKAPPKCVEDACVILIVYFVGMLFALTFVFASTMDGKFFYREYIKTE